MREDLKAFESPYEEFLDVSRWDELSKEFDTDDSKKDDKNMGFRSLPFQIGEKLIFLFFFPPTLQKLIFEQNLLLYLTKKTKTKKKFAFLKR